VYLPQPGVRGCTLSRTSPRRRLVEKSLTRPPFVGGLARRPGMPYPQGKGRRPRRRLRVRSQLRQGYPRRDPRKLDPRWIDSRSDDPHRIWRRGQRRCYPRWCRRRALVQGRQGKEEEYV
jgi:hypothetical protein